MIGTVVVSHGNIGKEMVRVARSIVTDVPPMVGVALEHDEDVRQMRQKIEQAIQEVDRQGGILLLSDMFGGTPSNLCLSFLQEGKIEVITGVNLPMLIKLANFREKQPLSEIASFIKEYGQKNIALAGQVLKTVS
jgi:PTS system mannose-specific IIA component